MGRYNWGLPKGTAVIYRGHHCVVQKEAYTTRFLDHQDYEMISHGMGHMAGSYGSAIDLFCVENGKEFKKVKPSNVKKLEDEK